MGRNMKICLNYSSQLIFIICRPYINLHNNPLGIFFNNPSLILHRNQSVIPLKKLTDKFSKHAMDEPTNQEDGEDIGNFLIPCSKYLMNLIFSY